MNVHQACVDLAEKVQSLETLLRNGVRSSALHLRSSAFPMLLLVSGCAIGPNYSKPEAIAPEQWKEAGDWIVAKPSDAGPKGKWWEAFNDPVVDSLPGQGSGTNQSLAAAQARHRPAPAAVASAPPGPLSALSRRPHAGPARRPHHPARQVPGAHAGCAARRAVDTPRAPPRRRRGRAAHGGRQRAHRGRRGGVLSRALAERRRGLRERLVEDALLRAQPLLVHRRGARGHAPRLRRPRRRGGHLARGL